MIKNNEPLSMAEISAFLKKGRENESSLLNFTKKFTDITSKDAKELKKKIESLDLMKIKPEYIIKKKDEYAIILEYLPNGYPLEKKMMPIAQAIGQENLVLLELVPRRGVNLESGQTVYIGEGKRPEVYY